MQNELLISRELNVIKVHTTDLMQKSKKNLENSWLQEWLDKVQQTLGKTEKEKRFFQKVKGNIS